MVIVEIRQAKVDRFSIREREW